MDEQKLLEAINIVRAALSAYGGGRVCIINFGNSDNDCRLANSSENVVLISVDSALLAKELVSMDIKMGRASCACLA